MKVSCPKCQKMFSAPAEWGGRKVRCPGCKAPVSLPKTEDAMTRDLGFDLGSLEVVEEIGEAIVRERKTKPLTLKEAQALAAATGGNGNDKAAKSDPTLRTCPGCGEKVRSPELYSDLMCRYCGAIIPGLEIERKTEARYTTLSDRMTTGVKFHSGFGGAALYPLPALGSVGVGMAIALAIIAVPLFPIIGFTGASGANEASRTQTDFGWVGHFLTVMFLVEALYFGAVAYYVMIDTIRTTTSGTEQPPPLTWSPTKLGGAVGGYLGLIVLYSVIISLVFLWRYGSMPASGEDLNRLMSDPVGLTVIALLIFALPMNLLGLASTHAVDALNPLKLGKSIGFTIGHYTFLFLIVLLYLGFYMGLMYAVMSWAGPMIMNAAKGDAQAGLAKVMLNTLMGLAAWAVLIGLMLYFGYCLGRVLGLFSRTYRERLAFEL